MQTADQIVSRPDGWVLRSYEQTFSAQAPAHLAGTTAIRWQAVDPAGDVKMSGYETRVSLEAEVDQRVASERRVVVAFADGRRVEMSQDTADHLEGLDAYGDLVVTFDGLTYALTPCCQASATGSMGATCCRSCYVEVDPAYGRPVALTDVVVPRAL